MDRFRFSGKEILEIALRIESNGEAFYREASNVVRHEDLQSLFLYLERQEKKHYENFKRFADLIKEEKITGLSQLSEAEEISLYLNALADSKVFTDPQAGATLGKEVKSDSEALEIAIGLEKDSIIFYYEMLSLVRNDDKKLVESLIAEEKDHVRRLREFKKHGPF